MCRLLSLACLLVLATAIAGCPEPPEDDLPDVSWDPPLTSSGGGELDFGDVPEGESVQRTITGTNNTDEAITFEIDVDLEAGDGWIASTPGATSVDPGDAISFGPRFNPNAGTPDDSTGSVAFLYGDHVVTYVIRGHVDRE